MISIYKSPIHVVYKVLSVLGSLTPGIGRRDDITSP